MMKWDSIIGAWLERVFRPGDNWKKMIDDVSSSRSNKRGGNARDNGLEGIITTLFGATSIGEALSSNLRGGNTRQQKKTTPSTKKSSGKTTPTKRSTKSTGRKKTSR